MTTSHDLVLFGATGFTGRLAARYLDAHAPDGLRWAIAARDPDKLARLADALATGPRQVVADGTDAGAIGALARSARVVCSTAGPFAKYSDRLVGACAEHGTHYCDITGETPWVRSVIDRFHDRAVGTGARIVPFCGSDAVPSDLGALMMVGHLREAHGQGAAEVIGVFTGRGVGVNGGTLASALSMAEKGQAEAMADPSLLEPDGYDGGEAPDDRKILVDPDLGVLGPSLMARINTPVVRRSAALCALEGAPWGASFRYREHLRYPSRTRAWFARMGLSAAEVLLQHPLGRALARRLGPEPGEGPSEEARQRAVTRWAWVAHGDQGGKAMGHMHVDADPANEATVMMLSEAALALAVQAEELPDRAGVLTPATGIGEVLLERLRAAGMTWAIDEG